MGDTCQRQKRPPELPGSAPFERLDPEQLLWGFGSRLFGSMGDMKAGNIQGLRDRTGSCSRLSEGSQRLLGGGIFLCGGGAGKLLGKFAEKALGRPGASFAKGANSSTGDIVGNTLEHAWILGPAASRQHSRRDLGHPETALAARGALPATFVGVELIQVIQRPDHIARVIHAP